MDEREPVAWNERHGGLFEPDIVLPAQFFRTLRGREALGGERRLIIAILEDAIDCFQKNLLARDNRGRRLFREAEKWVMSGDRELPFAFENICDFLSLDAGYIRRGLRRWVHATESEAARRLEADLSGVWRAPTAPAATTARRAAATSATDHAHTNRVLPLRTNVAV